jgi:hypothetical protein
MPELSVVPYPQLQEAYPDWELPGWFIDRIDLDWSYPVPGNRPAHMGVRLRHIYGHEVGFRVSPISQHPREWLTPILAVVALAPYRMYVDINAEDPLGY